VSSDRAGLSGDAVLLMADGTWRSLSALAIWYGSGDGSDSWCLSDGAGPSDSAVVSLLLFAAVSASSAYSRIIQHELRSIVLSLIDAR
jgi:hypothetical protein